MYELVRSYQHFTGLSASSVLVRIYQFIMHKFSEHSNLQLYYLKNLKCCYVIFLAKDTSLGITLIRKTGQDSCENSRRKWKHCSTRKLDKFLNPGYGCKLDQKNSIELRCVTVYKPQNSIQKFMATFSINCIMRCKMSDVVRTMTDC